MEAMEQAKKEKEAEKAAAAAAAVATTTVPYTPDYAAGLVSPAPAVSCSFMTSKTYHMLCNHNIIAITSTHYYTPGIYAEGYIQSNFNGSNTFGTMKISSRQG